MSIASRQVRKEVNRIIEERIKDGFIPTIDFIVAELSKFYSKVRVGFPSFMMRLQKYRTLWNVNAYNDNLSEIYDDLNNLYEEIVSQFTIILDNFDYAETERAKLFHEINSLNGDIENLMLISNDFVGYRYSVYDDFRDTSKVNLSHSTCEINSNAGICTIRESTNGVDKIDLAKYYGVVNFPMLAESQYAANIISNTVSPGSQFGNAFSNSSSSWMQNIVSKVPGKLVVSFIIDVSEDGVSGPEISRIEVTGQSPKNATIEPLWSNDNINFLALPMGFASNVKDSFGGSTTVWNFAPIQIRYIKFIVTKEIEDQQIMADNIPAYLYVIGFKNIGIYKMGYDITSTLYSNPFSITDINGESLTIDKASLLVEHDIQEGTAIDYYLSLGASGVTDPTSYEWVNISPTNDPIPEHQQIVDFRQVSFLSNVPDIQWSSASFNTPLEWYEGVPFYKVFEFPYNPISNTATLYRGKNDWQVDVQYKIDRLSVYDEAHTFGAGNNVTLTYPNFAPNKGQGLIRGSVVVKSDQGTNPTTTYLSPNDYSINYTTFVISKTTGSKILADPTEPANTIYVDYKYDKETQTPSIYTTYVYVLNSNGTDINLTPWSASDILNNNFTKIETAGNVVDVSTLPAYHLSPGWHQISTTGEPFTIYDRFYYANGTKRLHDLVYKQYAYAQPLQEVSWFDLKYNTFLSDHTKYAIYDYNNDGKDEIIVNYRPQTAKWSSDSDDLLSANGSETYVLSYKYIETPTDKIYLRATLSRSEDSSPLTTPTLKSYTIKLGY